MKNGVEKKVNISVMSVLPSSADLSLWLLKNPVSIVEYGVETAAIERIPHPKNLNTDTTPMLFLHGADYDDPKEVLRDFVQPFLTALLTEKSSFVKFDTPVYFVSWNSRFRSSEARTRLKAMNRCRQIVANSREIFFLSAHLRDVERRATQAGADLAPFIHQWAFKQRIRPTIVSHSLGAKVWLESLKFCRKNSRCAKPGIWWSLQPALSRRAFTTGGEYEQIARLYARGHRSKAVTWYSRMDFILSSIFLLAKGSLALGQFGCPNQILPQIDVTKWAREAHGSNHIDGRHGTFFRRTASLIPIQARSLGIIGPSF